MSHARAALTLLLSLTASAALATEPGAASGTAPAPAVVATAPAATAAPIAGASAPTPVPPVAAASTAEQLARQLIEMTGGGALGKQVMEQVVQAYRAANPNIPDEFWTEFMAGVNTRQLEDIAVPIYVQNLTVEEMQAAVQFYGSPAGQSIVRKLPVIVQQSMQAGQEWGRQLGRETADRISRYKQSHHVDG